MKKLRFKTASDAIYRSVLQAEKEGQNMQFTFMRWGHNVDEIGWYLEIPDNQIKWLSDEEVSLLED